MDKKYPIVRLQREQGDKKRIPGRPPGGFPAKLPYDRQVERLKQTFDNAAKAIDDYVKGVDVAVDPRTVVPERALVFELIGSVQGFDVAIQALGFEWLTGETLSDAAEDEEDEAEDDDVPAGKVIYMTMPTLEALQKLLAQWNTFKRRKGKDAPHGLAPLWNMFSYLRELRTWSAKDRVDPSVAKYVEAILSQDAERDVLVEFNFWYRADETKRSAAVQTLDTMLQEVGGSRLDFVEIPEIGYQGALVRVPSRVARSLAAADGKLARLDDVMTIRPQSAYESQIERPEAPTLRELAVHPIRTGPCIAALLDGYPVAAHASLNGRLHVHEVEIKAEDAPVQLRHHGTAMASLVLHGDLHNELPALSRTVALIPVLTGDARTSQESTPKDKLAIGIIYRALQAIVSADPARHPELANVTIINHSVCDTYAPFVRRPSPWAALLDHFSHRYRLLFVISAGNIFAPFPVPAYADHEEFAAALPLERQAAIMASLEQAKGKRGILSPAESVNGLTVGALHADDSPNSFIGSVDPYPQYRMPNLASAVGFGVNRSLKPDLLHPGGRFAASVSNAPAGGVSVCARTAPEVGQLVAAPSHSGDLRRVVRMSGTSNAAALITRAGVQLADAVDDAYANESIWLKRPTRAVILKALLAHGCSWDTIGDVLEKTYPPQDSWSRRRDTIGKLLGYGTPRFDRIVNGADNRITLLADDLLVHEQLHEYRLPIPKAMLQNKELRAITVTLAWTTPTIPTTIDYRGVALKLVNGNGRSDLWGGVQRNDVFQPNAATAERGTLIHMVMSGKKLQTAAFEEGIFIGVQALAKHKSQHHEPVPYALAVTMEVAQSVQTEGLYAQVQEAIAVRAEQRARAANRVR